MLVETHEHAGTRCARGAVIRLRADQLERLRGRVERINAGPAHEQADAGVIGSAADSPADDNGDGDDGGGEEAEDPEPSGLDEFLDQADGALKTLGLQLNRDGSGR